MTLSLFGNKCFAVVVLELELMQCLAPRACVQGCGMQTLRARECRGLGVHAFESGDSSLGY